MVTTPEGLSWIQDAYTTSDRYPYSEPYNPAEAGVSGAPFNYIRNSVKVVMDAYDGSVALYVMDPEDPVLAAYRRAFPELFRPLADLPEGLRAHLRYPQDLFQAQVTRYAAYHMQDPQVFYNKEDLWTGPLEKFGGTTVPMEPYYVLMRLPGEERLEFMLMLPMTPQGRDNLIAWVAARSDFPDYGRMVTFKLPKERLIYGPMQVEALIDQNTEISRQLVALGSARLAGAARQPAGDPDRPFPALRGAGVSCRRAERPAAAQADDRGAWRPSGDGADARGRPRRAVRRAGVGPRRRVRLPRARRLVGDIRARLADAEAALARGDWAGFGAAMDALKRAAERGAGTSADVPKEGGSP